MEIQYQVEISKRAPECIKIHNKLIQIIDALGAKRVLDIGCGAGDILALLIKHGIDVIGLEPNDLVEQAISNCGKDKIIRGSCYEEFDQTRLGSFDLVLSSEVIEHLYFPGKLIAFSSKALKEGGYLVLSTPHYGSYWRNLFISITNRWDYHHTPLWDGGHIKFFSKKTLIKLFSEFDFDVVRWDKVMSRRAPIFPMSLIVIAQKRNMSSQ